MPQTMHARDGFWEYDEEGVAWWISCKKPIAGPAVEDVQEPDAVQAEDAALELECNANAGGRERTNG